MKQTLPSVRERLRIANEKLSQKNGVNPDDQYYIRKKSQSSTHGVAVALSNKRKPQ